MLKYNWFYLWLHKTLNFIYFPGVGILAKHSFHRISGEFPKTLRKLSFSTKFSHQEIRWNVSQISVFCAVYCKPIDNIIVAVKRCKHPLLEADIELERFVIIVNGFQPLTTITKCSIVDVATALDPPLLYVMCRMTHFSG